MKLNDLKKEEGFWSAFFMVFLVSLALMGLGASVLMRSEGKNITNLIDSKRADYAANGGAYYAISRLAKGSLNESSPLTIGSCSVTMDTSNIAGTSEILLTVLAEAGNTERGVEVRLRNGGRLRDKAIFTTGDVFNVSAKDSTGSYDPGRAITRADSVPTMDETALGDLSTAQGNDQGGGFTPPHNYPNGSFYQADGVTPNVTHVSGNMTVESGRSIYGIFVVEGHVTLHGSARVYGVIFLPNATSTIITGGGDPSESSINGGIVSHGDISGFGFHISVMHWPEYMRIFCEYQIGPDPTHLPVIKWQYI